MTLTESGRVKIKTSGSVSVQDCLLTVVAVGGGGSGGEKEFSREILYPAFSLSVCNRTFPCMEANYSYAIKNQRGASKIPLVGGILRSKAPSRGLWMPELVLYGIRLQA